MTAVSDQQQVDPHPRYNRRHQQVQPPLPHVCFAHAGAAGYLYEPTIDQIREIMENLLANDPVWTPALQLSGGEPTVRDGLPEIVKMAKDLGFIHVEVNSNGAKMAESRE